MENGTSMVEAVMNGDTKQPFLIGVAGGTASGKVKLLFFFFMSGRNRRTFARLPDSDFLVH